MKRGLAIATIALSLLVVGSAVPSAFAAGTMSLKAVKKNGVAIPGGTVSTIVAAPNDIIEVEIKTCGWAYEIPRQTEIRAIQATIAMRAGATSSGCGTAIPTGWDRPLDPIACDSPADCPDEFPLCAGGRCGGPDHDPAGYQCAPQLCNAYFDRERSDAVCQEPVIDEGSITTDLNYAFYCVSFGGVASGPGCFPRLYLGTFSLKLSGDACGTFTFEILPGTPQAPRSFFQFENNEIRIVSVREPLVIQLPPLGDLDGNWGVDLADFVRLYPAFLPEGEPPGDDCPLCDLDHDEDIDLADFGVFQTEFTGTD